MKKCLVIQLCVMLCLGASCAQSLVSISTPVDDPTGTQVKSISTDASENNNIDVTSIGIYPTETQVESVSSDASENNNINVTSIGIHPTETQVESSRAATHAPKSSVSTITIKKWSMDVSKADQAQFDDSFSVNSTNSTWTTKHEEGIGEYFYFNGSNAFGNNKTTHTAVIPVEIDEEKSSTIDISFSYKLTGRIGVNIVYRSERIWNTNASTEGNWTDVTITVEHGLTKVQTKRHKRDASKPQIKIEITKLNATDELSPEGGFSFAELTVTSTANISSNGSTDNDASTTRSTDDGSTTLPPTTPEGNFTILYECSMKNIVACRIDFDENLSVNSTNATWTTWSNDHVGVYFFFNGSNGFSKNETNHTASIPVGIKEDKSSRFEISFSYALYGELGVSVLYQKKALWNINTSTDGNWMDITIPLEHGSSKVKTRQKRSANQKILFVISKLNPGEELSSNSSFSWTDFKVKKFKQKAKIPTAGSPSGSGLSTTTILAISVPCGAFVLVVTGAFVYRLTHNQEQSEGDPNDDPSNVNYDQMAVFYQERTYEGILNKVEALKTQKALEKIL